MAYIYQGSISQNTSADKLKAYKEAGIQQHKIRGNDISKIDRDVIPLENGGTKVIRPRQIANLAKRMLDNMRSNPQYSFIKPFITKPIIWTYEAKTAFTDGIRIYMSPAFASTLIGKKRGLGEANAYRDSVDNLHLNDKDVVRKYYDIYTKYMRFVVVHEIYHMFYNHVRRAALKYGSNPSQEEHRRANIAMDLEINRDIESTFPDLRGATEVIEGIWYQNPKFYSSNGRIFKKEIWEEIWDDWTENGQVEDFGESDQFNSEDVNPVQESKAKVGAFADGWRKAIDATQSGRINPETFNF